MAPRDKTLVGVFEIRFCFLDDAAEALEYFALRLHGVPHFRFPGQPHIFEHGYADALEIPARQGLRELAASLINGNGRAAVQSNEEALEKGGGRGNFKQRAGHAPSGPYP